MSNPSEMTSLEDVEISWVTDTETLLNEVSQANGINANITSDEGDGVDMDEGDDIFEDDGDDEFYEDYSQLEEVNVRKRRKEMDFFRDNEVMEMYDEAEFDERDLVLEPKPDIFQVQRKKRMPLYLLNPEDYAQYPMKQSQIRRAIITHRHHQANKAQIIRLTEESKKLRDHREALKAKVLELASCGCQENKVANLEVLDVEIPIVPPRMYVRGNRARLAVPFNKYQIPADIVTPSQENGKHPLVTAFNPPPCLIKVPEIPKPLQQISSSSTTSRVTAHGKRIVVTSVNQPVPASVTNNFQKNASSTGSTAITTEPGINPNQSNGAMTASKSEFAKGNTAPQTASQLLFAMKQKQKQDALDAALKAQSTNRLSAPQRLPLVDTTLATLINRRILVRPLKQVQPVAMPVSTFIKTASGRLLRVVPKTPHPLKSAPGSNQSQVAKYQPILPKPGPSNEPPAKRITKEDLKYMWSRCDDDEDEDELALIAALQNHG